MSKRVTSVPCIDHGAKVWLARYAKKNLWRVRAWYELEDLIQEGFMVFCRVLDKYRYTVKSQAHLMRLFQISVVNHFNDLSNQRTRDPVQVPVDDLATSAGIDQIEIWDRYAQDEGHLLVALIAHAPAPVKQLLTALDQADIKQLREGYRRDDGIRETTNEHLCHLAHLDPERVDVVTDIRNYLR